MKNIIQTKSAKWFTNKPVHCSGITHIADNGKVMLTKCYVKHIAGTHIEFMEVKTDLIIESEFGETYEICEDFVWHYGA
jgi:hypothetical protein